MIISSYILLGMWLFLRLVGLKLIRISEKGPWIVNVKSVVYWSLDIQVSWRQVVTTFRSLSLGRWLNGI